MPAADLQSDLDLLSAAAEEAGQVALRYWRGSPRSWDKAGGAGPVSEADLAVNDALRERLMAARPEYGWLSEEGPDDPDRIAARTVFIIDPIDGTRAYLAGEEGFSLSLAVVAGGRAIAGLVHLPAQGVTYTATEGGPALRNGTPIRVSEPSGIDGATVLTSRASMDPAHWVQGKVPAMQRKFRPSIAWRLCLVAEGRYDSVMTLTRSWDWDIAAGALIAERAGAVVSDRTGRPLRFNAADPRNAGMIAAAAPLHSAVLASLSHG